MKSYKAQLPVFYFLFYISFYISRYQHFYNFLEFHSTLSGKDIRPKFSLTDSLPFPQPHPLNGQNLLNVTIVFCQFSLKCLLKYFFFFKNLLTKFCKAFFKGSNYRFFGLFFRTNFKNSYFDTSISNYL